jgi:hypothetical protein
MAGTAADEMDLAWKGRREGRFLSEVSKRGKRGGRKGGGAEEEGGGGKAISSCLQKKV